jgi:FKBP-type peptidyl-prolyl cis-trans isomerase
MKRYIILLLVVITGLSACKKKTDDFDQNAQAAKDDAALNAYFTANHISPVKDPSGLYYTIDIPGNGDYPNSASTVTVDYTGKLLDGTQFDANDNYTASLSTGVISGWSIGVPRISVGGKITLYIPSAMGYGDVQSGSIPPNSPLIFTITLDSFK